MHLLGKNPSGARRGEKGHDINIRKGLTKAVGHHMGQCGPLTLHVPTLVRAQCSTLTHETTRLSFQEETYHTFSSYWTLALSTCRKKSTYCNRLDIYTKGSVFDPLGQRSCFQHCYSRRKIQYYVLNDEGVIEQVARTAK